jgi:hypothetical protein
MPITPEFIPESLRSCPPELIPEFVKLWQQGYEIVAGARSTREETFALRTSRKVFYRLVNALSDFELSPDVGEFQLVDRKVLDAVLKQYAQDPYVYDNHLRPQVEFVPAHRELLTFRLEEDGVRKALTRVNALAPASRFQQWAARTFPARLNRSKPSPEAEADFKGLRREIEDFYSQDMAHFGY